MAGNSPRPSRGSPNPPWRGALSRAHATLREARAHRDQDRVRRAVSHHLAEADAAQAGIFVAGINGSYLLVNAALCAMTGYTRDEIMALPSWDLIAPAERPRVAAIRGARVTGQAAPTEYETALISRTGEVIPVIARSHLLRDAAGAIGVMVEVVDLRGLRQAQQRGRHLTEVLDRLATASPVPLIVTDAEWRVELWSPAAERLFGWPAAEVTGRVLPVLSDTRRHAIARSLTEVRADAPVAIAGEPATCRDGRATPVDLHASATVQDGAVTGYVLAFEDVEDRAEAHRAQALERVRDRFLQTMSHELRTPLHAILGFAQLLDDGISGTLNRDQRDHVRDIRDAGRRLLSLVNDILDVASLDLGAWRSAPEPLDLAELAADVLEEVRRTGDVRDLAIRLDAPEPVEVAIDARSARLVLLHLLANAVQFTDRGDVTVTVRAEAPGAVVTVADTGIGIDPRDHRRLFDDFVQLRQRAGRLPTGTGLGLPLVRRLLDQMGGTIEVASTPGAGSTFTVRLPANAPT